MLHEIAHQLDAEDGVTDGAPIATETFYQQDPARRAPPPAP